MLKIALVVVGWLFIAWVAWELGVRAWKLPALHHAEFDAGNLALIAFFFSPLVLLTALLACVYNLASERRTCQLKHEREEAHARAEQERLLKAEGLDL